MAFHHYTLANVEQDWFFGGGVLIFSTKPNSVPGKSPIQQTELVQFLSFNKFKSNCVPCQFDWNR